jgi:hypothetical protein
MKLLIREFSTVPYTLLLVRPNFVQNNQRIERFFAGRSAAVFVTGLGHCCLQTSSLFCNIWEKVEKSKTCTYTVTLGRGLTQLNSSIYIYIYIYIDIYYII